MLQRAQPTPIPSPTQAGDPIIALRKVHKSFGRLRVLEALDLEVHQGRCLVILGVSGSGKSVILKHMVGLLRPDRGEVWFGRQRIDPLSEVRLLKVRRHFGFLFQLGALFDSLTVEENIAFPLREHTPMTDPQIQQVVAAKLALVGLPDVGRKMPAELSGGQRKRVALARAIAMDPQVILYDEPTTGLDPIRADSINALIIKLQRELRVTSVVVTHDMHSAFRIADRLVLLHEGRIHADGTPEDFQSSDDPIVRRFVTGESDGQE